MSRPKAAPRQIQKPPQTVFASLKLTLICALVFGGFSLMPRVRAGNVMFGSFIGAFVLLLILLFALWRHVRKSGRVLTYEWMPRPVHYVQLCMHSSVYAYWGWYWPPVYHFVPLIVAQLAFAYALDTIVCWFRRDKYILGFGPFPIILSTNLFLWFKDEWFYLQFLMIATGVLGKELVKWTRNGRKTHIFNPSAFSLSLFSIVLILMQRTDISWGQEIASTFQRPSYIYLEIFAVGMVVQALFSVTLVTLSSAAALYILNLAFTHSTGTYMFIDSNIPAAVFLGMHLLVTDPATSPHRNLGKIIFGLLYGLAVFLLYWWFDALGIPTFYDKLLPVPVLNLMVPLLDRLTRMIEELSTAFRPNWTLGSRQTNFVHMSVWIALFVVMFSTNFLGSTHAGSDLGFWAQACQDGKYNACRTYLNTLHLNCSNDRVAKSCVAAGDLLREGRGVKVDMIEAGKSYVSACQLESREGCDKLAEALHNPGPELFSQRCDDGDGASCFTLAVAYNFGKGLPADLTRALGLFHKSCTDGWSAGCGRLGELYAFGQGTVVDNAKAIENFEKACSRQFAPSCFNAAVMYRRGILGPIDELRAVQRLREACDLGFGMACRYNLRF